MSAPDFHHSARIARARRRERIRVAVEWAVVAAILYLLGWLVAGRPH